MVIPLGEDVAIPVTVVVVGDFPDVRPGVLRRLGSDEIHLWLAQPLEVGHRVVLAVGERTTLSGRVVGHDREILRVSRDAVRASDDRAAPRVRGRAVTKWRTGDEDEQASWINGGSADADRFAAVDDDVELSLSGMWFKAGQPIAVGTQVLLELDLAELGGDLRAVGAVRRIDKNEGAVAVEFLRLSEATFDALSEFTLAHVGG